MTPYLAMFKARFRLLLQYRAAALAGFATQLFWGGIRVMIFDAFYRSTTVAQPMTLAQTVSYLWLIQALLMLVPWNIDAELRNLIRSGGVVYELARPTDLYWLWFSRSVAGRTAPAVLRALPMFLIAGLFFGLQPPAGAAAAVVWALNLVGAVLLGSAITTLMAIGMMWTIVGDGLVRLLGTLTSVLSGSIVPLPFFPDWSQRLLALTPFAGIMDVPFRVYVGHIAPARGLLLFGQQLAWTAALVLLGRWLLGRARRRLVIQGG